MTLLTAPSWAAVALADAKALPTGGAAGRPAISPDGTLVAFVSDREGADNLYVVPLAGGTPKALTRETRAGVRMDTPRWSPDGAFLVYSSNKGAEGGLDLWTIGADGQRDEALTKDAAVDWMPSWSPDGKTIAFVSDRDGNDGLWLIGTDGSGLRKIAEMAYEPAYSPDGKSIAAYQVRAGGDGLYLFDAAGTAQPRLLLGGGRMPAWSPDGRSVVAVKTDDGGTRLWQVDVVKGSAEPLSDAAPSLAWPVWGKGGVLVYEAKPSTQRQLFLLTPPEVRAVTNIVEPLAGATVRGGVTVRVRVGAEGGRIATWALEFGKGANPDTWSPLADGTGAVDGPAATWNTSGLEGAYTLRLTTVTEGGETAVSVVPVTVYGQYGVLWQNHSIAQAMTVGQTIDAEVTLRNNGTMTWRNDGAFAVAGGYQWLDAGGVPVSGEAPLAALPQAVPAGEQASLRVKITAPTSPGRYTLRFDLRQGGQVWFHEQGARPLDVPVAVTLSHAAEIDVPAVPAVMVPGQIYSVEARVTNRGTEPWPAAANGAAVAADTVVLATRWRDIDGGLVDSPPAVTPLLKALPAGESAVVLAQVQAPSTNGRYLMSFEVRDQLGSFGPQSAISPQVAVSVSSPYSAMFGDHTTPGRMFPGELVPVTVQLRNTGALRWRADGATAVRLVTRWVDEKGRPASASNLPTPLPYDVPAGQTASVSARLQSPSEPGEYVLVWDLEQAGGRRFGEMGNTALKVPVMVGAPTHGVRWEQGNHPTSLVVGSVYTANIRLTNTGSMTWPAEGAERVRLGYRWVAPNGMEVASQPLFTDLEKAVDGGQTVTLTARLKAPERPGSYLIKWDLYQMGYDYFSARGAATMDVPVSVDVVYGCHWLSNDTPSKVAANQRYRVNLRLQNTGTIPWEAGGAVPVQVVYRWVNAAGTTVAVTDAAVAKLPALVQPGESVDVSAFLVAPKERGRFDLEWDLQFAGTLLFSDKGVAALRVPVTVE
ncbi:MAG: PD40 domain-containing protein [Armatimonadetes bacterium]|nr:PD40 domain-containing protein [Armatimonadota bacterium]